MKLALHRSLAFWAGFTSFGFTCWAWRDSMKFESWTEGRGWYAANSGAAITVAWESRSSADHLSFDRMEIWEETRVPGAFRSPMWMRGESKGFESFSDLEEFSARTQGELDSETVRLTFLTNPPSDFLLLIPHWLIIGVIAGPWLSLLLLRLKRRKQPKGFFAS